MRKLGQKIYIAAGYNTAFIGPGRPEFNPKALRPYEEYLLEAAQGVRVQQPSLMIDEGVIGSFMSARFLNQGNLPGFLPFVFPELLGSPCVGVEGACATGGKAIITGIKSVLAGCADTAVALGFEMQNTLKPVLGADVLAGAAYYRQERQKGHAFFFPALFAQRAEAYYAQYGYAETRKGLAAWYENSILNARKNPKAQEFYNKTVDLLAIGLQDPIPETFIPFLNHADCSKVSDGASALLILSEEGLRKNQIPKSQAIELVAMGEAEADITQPPKDLTQLSTTKLAVKKALENAHISLEQLGWLELHDCFSITGLLALEAIGFAKPGTGAHYICEGHVGPSGIMPTNLSGGLCGYGHPTGATGVRQLVDLWEQLTGKAPQTISSDKEYAMMVNMGGNDVTVCCLIVKRAV